MAKTAKTHKLLSVKGKQDKMPKIKPNSEDKAAQTVGGPEPTWSTAQYATMKFDAILGVKPDTTIPVKVKGEKMTVVKEEEELDDETLTDALSFESDDDEAEEDGEELKKVDESSDEDDDDASEEESTDDDAEEDESTDDSGEESEDVTIEDGGDDDAPVEIEDSVEVDDTPAEGDVDLSADMDDENDIEITLDDLVDEDTTMIDLGDDDEEVMTDAVGDLPGDDTVPMKMNSQTGIEETDDMMAAGEDELPIEEGDAVEGDEDEEPLDESTEEEDADKDKQEEPMAEQKKIVVKFKLDEATKLFTTTTLTEEEVRQTRSLFEAAVRSTAIQIGKQLQETYQARFAEARRLHEAKVAQQVDQYLSYVVEQWVRENEGSLKAQLQNRLTENFMRGLKTLFVENYIDVPESKINVVEALAKNVKGLKKKLKEQETRLVKLHTESKAAVTRERQALVKEHKARLIAEAASSVTAVDRGAFTQRAQSVAFTNTKSFRKDLTALKEQYFGATKQGTERPVNAPVAAPLFEEKKSKSSIDVYVDAASRLASSR